MIALPTDRDRRADKVRRIRSRYTHLRVTRATAQLVAALVADLDAFSIDEALFYIVMHEIGLERSRLALAGSVRDRIYAGLADLGRCV